MPLLQNSWLAGKGHDVELIKPSGKRGRHTPDMRLDGELWEAKRVESTNPTKLKTRIAEAKKQSPSIIVDLSINTGDLNRMLGAALLMLEDPQIDRIMIVVNGSATIYEK